MDQRFMECLGDPMKNRGVLLNHLPYNNFWWTTLTQSLTPYSYYESHNHTHYVHTNTRKQLF